MRKFNITVNGIAYEVDVEEVSGASAPAPVSAPAAAPVAVSAAPVAQAAASAPKPAASHGVAGSLLMKSPMPGTILDVKVAPGDTIKKGAVLLILEAMKMENEIKSPRDGVIASVNVTKGASINSGDLMLSLT